MTAEDNVESASHTYDDSSVLKYVCQSHIYHSEISDRSDTITGFAEMPGWLSDPKLTKVYR